MTTRIKNFEQFIQPLVESDGFGTSPFLLEKIEGIYHYFFNIEKEEKEGETGYHLIIGKYSDKEIIEGAKNSYCVLSLNEISPELIEDIAIDKTKIPPKNSEVFKVSENELTRLLQSVYRCVGNYLEVNPKVTRIYDEIQDNLQFSDEGTYLEFMKSLALSQIGTGWSVQEGNNKKTILLSR